MSELNTPLSGWWWTTDTDSTLQFSNIETLSGHTVVGVPATDQYETE
jgi:hypothetical protein